MEKVNLEKYFDNTDNKYYDASYLIKILEEILEKSIDNIKEDVKNIKITITRDEIENFLEKTFQEEDSRLKERIIKQKPGYNFDLENGEPISMTKGIKLGNIDVTEKFSNIIRSNRYQFIQCKLECFNKYTTIVRNKALQLLNIIEQIGNRQSITIKDTLLELDIQLDENGNIKREDIIRLIKPTIHNIKELVKKTNKANDPSTYLTFKMSNYFLYRDGCFEEDLYPDMSIIINGLFWIYNESKGDVPPSSRQKQELNKSKKTLKKLPISPKKITPKDLLWFYNGIQK